MASPTITSVSKDVKRLHDKFDEWLADAPQIESSTWWGSHLGWAIACFACLVIGWLAHGLF